MIVVFHHNDLDGRAAAAIIYQNYCNNPINEFKFIEVNYNTSDLNADEVEDCDTVFIVDYSISQKNLPELIKIREKAERLYWIDHHKTSMEIQATDPKFFNSIQGIRIDGYSGALLAWYWVAYYTESTKYDPELTVADIERRLEVCPMWVRLVDDWDTFKLKLESKEFKLGIESVDHRPTADCWKNLFRSIWSENKFIGAGAIITRYLANQDAALVKSQGFEAELNGVKCFVMNRVGNSTMFGDKYYEYPFVCTCSFNGKRWTYSLYSNGAHDVSVIAKSYGGGGRRGAAGFTIDEFLFDPSKSSE
jgi:nanoRNase/pAp phosphatase (c-di-AMP/oligoRNAs hydrolase)